MTSPTMKVQKGTELNTKDVLGKSDELRQKRIEDQRRVKLSDPNSGALVVRRENVDKCGGKKDHSLRVKIVRSEEYQGDS